MYRVNRECRRRNPCCWCTFLLNKVFVIRLHQHKCNRVDKRYEHRPMCTTPVVRRCSRSIRCPSSPIRWGSRCKWFYLQCFETFLPSNIGTWRCRRSLICPLGKSLRLLNPIGSTPLAPECMRWRLILVDIRSHHNVCKQWNRKIRHNFLDCILGTMFDPDYFD